MRRSLFACLMAAAAAPVGADEVTASEPAAEAEARRRKDAGGEAIALQQVQVTATRRPESGFDVSSGVTVVGPDEIAARAPQTVADYLRGQPGAFVQSTTPGQAIPIVRGLKGSEVLHMVDGFRLNTAFFRNSPNQYFALVDAQNVERVEVVRGPSSTLYGSDAMGGVVQVITPEQRFDGDGWGGRGHFRTQLASGDLSKLARVDGAAGRQDFSISGGVTWQDVGERRRGDGPRLPHTQFRAWAADTKLIWNLAPEHELMFNAQYLKQPKTPRFDELVPGFHQETANSDEFYFEPNDRLFAHARYRWNAMNVAFDTAELHLGYQEINDDRRSRGAGSANRDLEQNRDRLRGFTGSFTKQIGAHALAYGFEAYWDTVDSRRTRVNVDSGAASTRAPRFPDGSTMDSFALYLDDSIELAPRWQLDLGARYSRFEIELPANGGIGSKLDPDDVTGNAGLTFKATDTLHLVTNLGRGFRAPNIFDLGVFGDRPGGRFAIPNADLKPETVVTWDVGVKYDTPGFQAEAFLWRSNYKDKITSVDIGEDEEGRILVQNRNVTELKLWGAEIGARWTVNEALTAYGVLNLTRGEEEYTGDRYDADRIPPLNGRLGVEWRVAPHWDVEAWALYAARQDRLSPRDLEDPRVNPAGTAGWNTWNVRVGWDFAPGATLGLRLENLADRRYREHGSGLDEVGRSAVLTLDWRF
ncbi:TonB-dependent receptor plug domain-containing protein [Dokdonella ginsengisoli]|uniref:TonB-dependent receptor plug domain-containing protein n=1 Tax=Dokdonella ginsengisoli TaxID=363846 RepID=A0ABV9R188_9GAMM